MWQAWVTSIVSPFTKTMDTVIPEVSGLRQKPQTPLPNQPERRACFLPRINDGGFHRPLSMNLDAPASIERRMVLARLLQIPPCLLALDWRFMAYKDNTIDQESPFADMVGLMEEDTYEFYDDLLAVGWESTYKGGSPQTATRITKRLHKLEKLTEHTPPTEREAWLSLLCRYYQLSTRFARDRVDTNTALSHAQKAIDLANTLKDIELIAASHFRRIRVYMDLYEFVKKLPGSSQNQQATQYLDLARFDVNEALKYVERVRNPLKSNIYLNCC
jgi:tetratricopeptide (TPR) repeat protein